MLAEITPAVAVCMNYVRSPGTLGFSKIHAGRGVLVPRRGTRKGMLKRYQGGVAGRSAQEGLKGLDCKMDGNSCDPTARRRLGLDFRGRSSVEFVL